MLDKKGTRQLAYLVTIDAVYKHPNADRLDIAEVGGWKIITGLNELQVGEPAVYFEIDSKLPEKAPFTNMDFLVSKHYKVKTQKIRGTYSQGMLMPVSAFDGTEFETAVRNASMNNRWLTSALQVTYASAEDNARKAPSADKYKKMASRHPNVFKKPVVRWLMKRSWGKKLLFVFFGKKKDTRNWPSWVLKTDEERAQNQAWRFHEGNTEKWIVSEKIDGTSTTATWKRRKFGQHDFYICSRNVVFDKPDKKCYYETNVYTEMAEKYHFEEVLGQIANELKLEWITLQGETYGTGVQKRDYSIKEHDFAGFNLIFSTEGRINSYKARDLMAKYGIPWVPLICDDYILPATVDEMLTYAEGNSALDGKPREGVVLRSQDGKDSFKSVSNAYLVKYHQ